MATIQSMIDQMEYNLSNLGSFVGEFKVE